VVLVSLVAVLAAAASVLAWSNRTSVARRSGDTPTATSVGPSLNGTLLDASAADIAAARATLESLPAASPPAARPVYRRAAFGEAWADTDGNGCNQRDDVLLRDVVRTASYTAARQGACDHDLLAGTWRDPYTGAVITLTDAKRPDQAQSVQIDHLVALSVAWRDGADSWGDAERLRFATDLRNLVAVGAASNKAKGDSDAAAWRPARAAQCGYAVRYVTVKGAYSLRVDAAEERALADMLAACPP
jgi:Protein of unknown function (DUF1524)